MNYSYYDYSKSRLIRFRNFNLRKKPILTSNGNYVVCNESIRNWTVYDANGGVISVLIDADRKCNGFIALRNTEVLSYHRNGCIKFWVSENKQNLLIRNDLYVPNRRDEEDALDKENETQIPWDHAQNATNDIREALEMSDGTLVLIQRYENRSERILFLDSSGVKKFEYELKTRNYSSIPTYTTKTMFESKSSSESDSKSDSKSSLFVWTGYDDVLEFNIEKFDVHFKSHPLYQFCKCKEKRVCSGLCKGCKKSSALYKAKNTIRWLLFLKDGSLLYQSQTNQVLIWNPRTNDLRRVMNWKYEMKAFISIKNGKMVDTFEWVKDPKEMMPFDSVQEMENGLLVGYTGVRLFTTDSSTLTFFDRANVIKTVGIDTNCKDILLLGRCNDKIGLITREGLWICNIFYRFEKSH